MWELFFNVLLKLLGFGLSKNKQAKEAKKKYLAFVAAMERDSLASVNLNEMDRAQADELNERRDQLDRAQTTDQNRS